MSQTSLRIPTSDPPAARREELRPNRIDPPALTTRDFVTPHEHVGLVMLEASRAATRFGGEVGEWIGPAFLAAHDAARTYRPERGFAFSTHCVAAIRWKLLGEFRLRAGGKRSAGDWRFLSLAGQPADPERDAMADLAAPTANDDEAPEPERVWGACAVLSPRSREIALLRARGLSLEAIGAEVGLTRERVRQILDIHVRCALREFDPAAGPATR